MWPVSGAKSLPLTATIGLWNKEVNVPRITERQQKARQLVLWLLPQYLKNHEQDLYTIATKLGGQLAAKLGARALEEWATDMQYDLAGITATTE